MNIKYFHYNEQKCKKHLRKPHQMLDTVHLYTPLNAESLKYNIYKIIYYFVPKGT